MTTTTTTLTEIVKPVKKGERGYPGGAASPFGGTHNSLSGIQGGDSPTEAYHFTLVQHSALTDFLTCFDDVDSAGALLLTGGLETVDDIKSGGDVIAYVGGSGPPVLTVNTFKTWHIGSSSYSWDDADVVAVGDSDTMDIVAGTNIAINTDSSAKAIKISVSDLYSYTFEHSLDESSAGHVQLVGDSESPGNSQYYGTNGSGTKGFYALPDSMVWPSSAGIAVYSGSSSWSSSISPSTGYLRYTGAAFEWKNETYSLSNHDHSGTYEPVISKSTGYLTWTGAAWSWKNETYSTTGHTHAHNDTTSPQGGTTNQYYHMTSGEYSELQGWLGIMSVESSDDVYVTGQFTAGSNLRSEADVLAYAAGSAPGVSLNTFKTWHYAADSGYSWGTSDVVAVGDSDTMDIVPGTNITLQTDATNKAIKISVTDLHNYTFEHSIDESSDGHVQLVGDLESPGNSKYYGTNGSGVKSFYDLPDDMVWPGAGIALSTGSAWDTSITNNSANWNTAYGWGNHAGLYDAAGTGHSEATSHVSSHESTYNHSNYNTAYTWVNTNGTNVTNHIASTSNPHSVTATQVNLGNVTNESKATMFTTPTFTGGYIRLSVGQATAVRTHYLSSGYDEWSVGMDTDYNFKISDSDGFSSTRFTILTSNGNVGIGTTAPSTILHLKATTPQITFTDDALSSSPNIGLTNTINSAATMNFGFAAGEGTGRSFNFRAAGANIMTILGTGNVGISTTAPDYLLDVGNDSYAGSAIINANAAANQQTGFNLQAGGSSKWYMYRPASSNDLRFWDGSDRITFQSGGNVGIGTTSPQALLSLGSTNGAKFFVYDQGYQSVQSGFGIDMSGESRELTVFHTTDGTSGRISLGKRLEGATNTYTPAMTILGSGNVGIATTDPATKLTVNGAVRILETGLQLYKAGSNDWLLYNDGADLKIYETASSTIVKIFSNGALKCNGDIVAYASL